MRMTIKAIIEYENKILILKDKNGNYDLPGGGLEKDESLDQACFRELLEETSYKNYKIVMLLPNNYNYSVMKNPEYASTMYCYVVNLIDIKNGTKVEEDTAEEWVSKEELLLKFENRDTSRHKAMRNCIKDYLRKTNT
jgi:ADP-ribose pyrophosphatase YjhB (NUDIX family)